jgi:hypothetical protein
MFFKWMSCIFEIKLDDKESFTHAVKLLRVAESISLIPLKIRLT